MIKKYFEFIKNTFDVLQNTCFIPFSVKHHPPLHFPISFSKFILFVMLTLLIKINLEIIV